MSKMIPSFDPTVGTSGTFPHNVGNPCGGIYLFNESNVWLQLRLPGGHQVGLPAWWSRFYRLDEVLEPVQWQELATIPSLSAPLAQVYGEAYESSELRNRSFYDGPIPRNPYIGNTVSSNVSTNQVINDGNLLMQVLEATQQGNTGGSNLSFNNDGSFYVAQWVSSVYTKLLNLVPGASPVLELGAKLILQALDQSGNNLSNILGIDSSGNTFLQSHKTNKKTVIYSNTGVALLTVNDTTQGVEIPTSAVSINGTTAGSAQLYMPFTGTNFKVAILVFTGYQNNSATEQTISLPVAFSTRCNWLAGNGKPTRPYLTGTPLTNKVNVNNNGTATQGNTVNSNNMGEIIQGFDALGLGTNEVSAASAIYFFVGL